MGMATPCHEATRTRRQMFGHEMDHKVSYLYKCEFQKLKGWICVRPLLYQQLHNEIVPTGMYDRIDSLLLVCERTLDEPNVAVAAAEWRPRLGNEMCSERAIQVCSAMWRLQFRLRQDKLVSDYGRLRSDWKFVVCCQNILSAVPQPISAPPSRYPFVKHHVRDTGHCSQNCHALRLSVTISLNATSTCPAVSPRLFIRCCSCESICVNIGYSFVTYYVSHDSTGAPRNFSYIPSIHPDYVHPISWTSL